MKRANTQLLSEILEDFLVENPFISEKLAESRLLNAWPQLLGHLTERYTSQLYIRKRTLYVGLTSAVLRNELCFCQEKLLSKLNEAAGLSVIDNIVLL